MDENCCTNLDDVLWPLSTIDGVDQSDDQLDQIVDQLTHVRAAGSDEDSASGSSAVRKREETEAAHNSIDDEHFAGSHLILNRKRIVVATWLCEAVVRKVSTWPAGNPAIRPAIRHDSSWAKS